MTDILDLPVYKDAEEKAKGFAPHEFETDVDFIGGFPRILVSEKAFKSMWCIVDIADDEVGWLGLVKREGNDFLIEDIFLFEQEVNAFTCEITSEGISQVAHELMETHPEKTEVINRMLFWGHSHVDMETSPSGQDEEQMEIFAENGCPYCIRGILNKDGKMEFTIFLYDIGVVINDAEWSITAPKDDELYKQIKEDFDMKVGDKPIDQFFRHNTNDDLVYDRPLSKDGEYYVYDITTKFWKWKGGLYLWDGDTGEYYLQEGDFHGNRPH